jgi:hypothetical protein
LGQKLGQVGPKKKAAEIRKKKKFKDSLFFLADILGPSS